jgi:two-component system, cell cycle sensor histidine kinase and response regulator CckA
MEDRCPSFVSIATRLLPAIRQQHPLLDALADVIVTVDDVGLVLYVNSAVQRLLGYRPKDVIGRSVFDLLHPADCSKALRGFASMQRRQEVMASLCLRCRRHDGGWASVEVLGFDRRDDPEVGAIVLQARGLHGLPFRDENQRPGDEYLREAFQHAPLGLAVTAPSGRFVQVNPAFEAITGYQERELGARDIDSLVHPDDRTNYRDLLARVLVGELPAFTAEQRWFRREGGPVWVRASVSLIHGAGGELRVITLLQNITEQRRLEEQCRQAQKMEAIGRLASGVAHDFNNIITVVNGYGDILLQNLPPEEQTQRGLLHQICKAGERGAALTRQLLIFSRRQFVSPAVIDLRQVVAEAGLLLRRLIGEDVEYETCGEADLWLVKADPGQMEQALMNLVVNARDALPDGGKIVIEAKNVHLDDCYSATHPEVRPGPYVLLAVSDNGCGMPPEVKAHMFEPFFTTKEPGKGTGLGLATVYGIVKQAGGHVDVYSEPGLGTTCKLYLPRCETPQEAGMLAASAEPLPRGSESILLVEDEEAVRDLGQRVLQDLGYQVFVAADGAEALQVAGAQPRPIDLLLTDVVMPRLGGRAVADQLRRRQPGLKVLYLSGYTDDAVVRHGVLEQDVPFLQKPFGPHMLARRVRAVLDNPAATVCGSPVGG